MHLSWWRIITEAIVQHRHRGVSDPDQAWILGELIAYLDDERSGASGFQDMGENWVKVRNGAGDGTLRAADAEVRDVAALGAVHRVPLPRTRPGPRPRRAPGASSQADERGAGRANCAALADRRARGGHPSARRRRAARGPG